MGKGKKVLHVVEAFGGGVFTFLVDLVNNTIGQYDVTIAYSIRKQTPKDFEKYFDDRVKFIEVENFTRSINLKKDFKSFIELRKIIKKEDPNIVHLHSSKAGILGRLAISGKKVRMLYNPHGFSFFKKDDSKLKRMIYWWSEKTSSMINRKCTIVGCSQGEYEEAKKLSKNAICINNGVNVEELEKEVQDFDEKKIDLKNLKICTVGRIGYQKNPSLFNKIAEQNPNIRFTWIGDGELSNVLTSDNIEVTGWKSKTEVMKILNDNDIFILTSLWEGLPISLLEAMYMKKICIVSNCIGNKDVIENNINGFVCDNLDEFDKIISSIKDNAIQVNSISEKANGDVRVLYNMKEVCKKYINEYNK